MRNNYLCMPLAHEKRRNKEFLSILVQGTDRACEAEDRRCRLVIPIIHSSTKLSYCSVRVFAPL